MITKHFKNLPVGNVFIAHSGNNAITATIYTSRTALILGNNDENVDALKAKLTLTFPQYNFTLEVKEERVYEWLNNGAQPSESVLQLFTSVGLMGRYERLKKGEALETVLAESKAAFEARVVSPKTNVTK